MQKISPENSLTVYRDIEKKRKDLILSYDVNDHVYSKVKVRLTSYGSRWSYS